MPDRVVDGDVRAAEAVDRLLRVADDGQAARPRPRARASRRRARRRSRCRARSPPGRGRCPGTRRRGSTVKRRRKYVARLGALARAGRAPTRAGRRSRPFPSALRCSSYRATNSSASGRQRDDAPRVRSASCAASMRLAHVPCGAAFESAQRSGSSQSACAPVAGLQPAARGRGSRARARPGRRSTAASARAKSTIACMSRAPTSSLPAVGQELAGSRSAASRSSASSVPRCRRRRGLGCERQQRAVARARSRRACGSARGRSRGGRPSRSPGARSARSSVQPVVVGGVEVRAGRRGRRAPRSPGRAPPRPAARAGGLLRRRGSSRRARGAARRAQRGSRSRSLVVRGCVECLLELLADAGGELGGGRLGEGDDGDLVDGRVTRCGGPRRSGRRGRSSCPCRRRPRRRGSRRARCGSARGLAWSIGVNALTRSLASRRSSRSRASSLFRSRIRWRPTSQRSSKSHQRQVSLVGSAWKSPSAIPSDDPAEHVRRARRGAPRGPRR